MAVKIYSLHLFAVSHLWRDHTHIVILGVAEMDDG